MKFSWSFIKYERETEPLVKVFHSKLKNLEKRTYFN